MKTSRRNKHGSAIVETGPALYIFLLMVFFPLLDVMHMACAYSMAWLLHSYELRELSVRTPASAAAALGEIDNQFITRSTGLAAFLGVTPASISHPAPTYLPNAVNPTEVSLTTTVAVKPLLVIPILPGTPGLNAPMPFKFSGTTSQEENDKN